MITKSLYTWIWGSNICPHVRVGVKRMVVKVTKYIASGVDLNKFFRITKNFSKKFYKLRYRIGNDREEEYQYIKLDAIGVSRDLIYRVYWEILCKVREDLSLPLGYYPIDEGNRNWLYPLYDEQIDDDSWRWNCFERENFIQVDLIEDI